MASALISKTADGYGGMMAGLSVLATGDSVEHVRKLLAEGLALYLEDNTDTVPGAQRLSDLPADVQDLYAGEEPCRPQHGGGTDTTDHPAQQCGSCIATERC